MHTPSEVQQVRIQTSATGQSGAPAPDWWAQPHNCVHQSSGLPHGSFECNTPTTQRIKKLGIVYMEVGAFDSDTSSTAALCCVPKAPENRK
jgi:hypothetical protein